MNPSFNAEADAKVADALATLKMIQEDLGKVPTLDLPFSTLASHVADHQHDTARLRDYGNVIANRNTQFAMLTAIKGYWNIQSYVNGVEVGNPLVLPSAARAQIELFALAWHVSDIVTSNAGFEKPNLVQRMMAVDEALIMAIYGTRSPALVDVYRRVDLSKLRPAQSRDIQILKAKNILTRIQKTQVGAAYNTCLDDYERLSELLHPNSPQNLLFMVPSPIGDGSVRVSLRDAQHVRRAQYQSAFPMLNSSVEIFRLILEKPDPFPQEE